LRTHVECWPRPSSAGTRCASRQGKARDLPARSSVRTDVGLLLITGHCNLLNVRSQASWLVMSPQSHLLPRLLSNAYQPLRRPRGKPTHSCHSVSVTCQCDPRTPLTACPTLSTQPDLIASLLTRNIVTAQHTCLEPVKIHWTPPYSPNQPVLCPYL